MSIRRHRYSAWRVKVAGHVDAVLTASSGVAVDAHGRDERVGAEEENGASPTSTLAAPTESAVAQLQRPSAREQLCEQQSPLVEQT